MGIPKDLFDLYRGVSIAQSFYIRNRWRVSPISMVEKMLPGGQVLIADTVENYPGFPEGIKGPDLAEWIFKQAGHFGLETETAEVAGIEKKGARPGAGR